MTKHVKVSIIDGEDFTEDSVVEIHDLDETGIPMALMRAVAALCVTAGLPTPAQEFQRVAVGTENVARLTEELAKADGGVRGLLEVIQKQANAALPAYKLASAIGPRFVETLALTREAHRAVSIADSDIKSLTNDSGDYRRALTRLYGAVGNLLHELRRIEPEDRPGSRGGTTVTLTEAVDLGATSATDTPS